MAKKNSHLFKRAKHINEAHSNCCVLFIVIVFLTHMEFYFISPFQIIFISNISRRIGNIKTEYERSISMGIFFLIVSFKYMIRALVVTNGSFVKKIHIKLYYNLFLNFAMIILIWLLFKIHLVHLLKSLVIYFCNLIIFMKEIPIVPPNAAASIKQNT